MSKNNQIMVSIICCAYNHEKFIKNTLDGFINQKTDFLYEILIHDDASTDNTSLIIKEYETKYPNLIKPIYQTENQFSKGIGVSTTYQYPRISGKYVAFCEGDDCWIDENKLQKQVDCLEKETECVMCVHNTRIHDLINNKDTLFCKHKKRRYLNENDVFMDWSVHLSSYLIRAEKFHFPDIFKGYWFGDYILLTYEYTIGKIVYLPDVMSVYNYNNCNGITYQNKQENCVNAISKLQARADYLEKLNVCTNRKYEKIIKLRLDQISFSVALMKCRIDMMGYNSFHELKRCAMTVRRHSFYKNHLKSLSFIKRLMFRLKYGGYIFGFLWSMSLKMLRNK